MPNGLLEQQAPMPGQPTGQVSPVQPGPAQMQPTPAQGQVAGQMQGQPMPRQQGEMPQMEPVDAPRDYNLNPLGPGDAEALDMFIVSAQKLIHSPQSRDSILNRIGVSSRGPIDDISDTVVTLVDRIDQQATKDTGRKVDNAVKIQGANAIAGEVISVAEAAGKIPQMSEEEKAVTYSHAVQKYTKRMVDRGEITNEELARYAQEAKGIAEQKGDLNPQKIDKVQTAATAQAPAAGSTPGRKAPIGGGAKPMSEILAERGGLLDG